MKKGPFKMKGMTFKEGQSPMRQLTLSCIGERIKSRIQEMPIVKALSRDDEDVENGEEEKNGEDTEITPANIDTNVNVEGTIITPDDELTDVTKIVPTTPMTKRSPAKIYKKSAKKSQKKY